MGFPWNDENDNESAAGAHSRQSPEGSQERRTTTNQRRWGQGGGDVEQTIAQESATVVNCLYIVSGDLWNERYRLATFGRFPALSLIAANRLALNGLYYTGFEDCVKCISCCKESDNWVYGTGSIQHTDDCLLTHGREPRNIPIHVPNIHDMFSEKYDRGEHRMVQISSFHRMLGNQGEAGISSASTVDAGSVSPSTSFGNDEPARYASILRNNLNPDHTEYLRLLNLRDEADRRKTFRNWPSYPAPLLVSSLARDGFFYLGNVDRVKCYYCSRIFRNWKPQDNAKAEHKKHSPYCRICLGLDAGNIPLSESARQRLDENYANHVRELNSVGANEPFPSLGQLRGLAELFPCLNAINSHMATLQSRVETFGPNWPHKTLSASCMAKAGLLYLGDEDRTKCFYCNGGLQNWQHDDDPWIEHAKWFPGCEFILRQRGANFVRRITEAHPNLDRPKAQERTNFPRNQPQFLQTSQTMPTRHDITLSDPNGQPIPLSAQERSFTNQICVTQCECLVNDIPTLRCFQVDTGPVDNRDGDESVTDGEDDDSDSSSDPEDPPCRDDFDDEPQDDLFELSRGA